MSSAAISCEINRRSADPSILGMDSPPEEVVAGGSPAGDYPIESMISINGFRAGDMVWGKVKSHPWWPGYIFNEALASHPVRKMKTDGHVLVAFFGDSSYGWFDPAELIPFNSNFPEKSRQTTTSRNFIKAVGEAVYEVRRRAALALTCYCCRPDNFRPTDVPGFFSVNVVGFELAGIYSSEQILNARNSFEPAQMLSFVQQLAEFPRTGESSNNVDWIRTVATLLAYRGAVFEELDETYAEAFGTQPVHHSKKDSASTDQQTRAAPLSGPLVIAEALGGANNKRSFSSAAAAAAKPTTRSSASKNSSSKKNNYVLKRRDESPTITTLPLDPVLNPATGVVVDKLSDITCSSLPDSAMHEYKNDKPLEGSEITPTIVALPDSSQPKLELVPAETKLHDPVAHKARKRSSVDDHAVKTKAKKRDLNSAADVVALPQLLTDLTALALDPFHGLERCAPDVVRHAFLRFRSAVFQKSLIIPSAGDNADVAASGKKVVVVKDQQREVLKTPPSKPVWRLEDPTKSGQKRRPSDRQAEQSVKRKKKLSHTKGLATEKKAAMAAATALAIAVAASPVIAGVAEDAPAPEAQAIAEVEEIAPPPPPPRVLAPTFLSMKFPPRASLPSISSLKARFGRFGPLDLSGIRVHWKSYTCRVLFFYKADAEAAFEHCTGTDLFGQVKVKYSLQEVEAAPAIELPPAVPVNENSGTAVSPPRPPPQPRKSNLKIPGDPPAREGARVRFSLGGGVVPAPRPRQFQPAPIPTPPSPPPRVMEVYQYRAPATFGEAQLDRRTRFGEAEGSNNVDISDQMMSLLQSCSDVVANLKSSMGHVPYRRL